jgi:hypothetical protein
MCLIPTILSLRQPCGMRAHHLIVDQFLHAMDKYIEIMTTWVQLG